jgi:hypothetical protein
MEIRNIDMPLKLKDLHISTKKSRQKQESMYVSSQPFNMPMTP